MREWISPHEIAYTYKFRLARQPKCRKYIRGLYTLLVYEDCSWELHFPDGTVQEADNTYDSLDYLADLMQEEEDWNWGKVL